MSQEPLLADGALTWRDPAAGTSSGAAPVPGWGRPPLPPAGPRAIAGGRRGAHASMARSLRLFPSALSPHSMASGVGFGSGFERCARKRSGGRGGMEAALTGPHAGIRARLVPDSTAAVI